MIRLTKLALQRPVTVILCLVTIAYFGFQSLIGARMELIPEMELPMLLISTKRAFSRSTLAKASKVGREGRRSGQGQRENRA